MMESKDPLADGDVEVLPPSTVEEHAALAPLEAIERGQLDVQISTARRYPRTLSKVKADMLSFASLDEETAAACFYTLPRGGKSIQGPSVRLAEIAVSCYGNLRAGSRVIEVVADGDKPHVVVQAVAHDLEKNTAITIEKRRRITGKQRNQGKPDEDDINLACNAASSIAFRDAVFKIIPQALIRPVYLKAKLVAVGDVKSLVQKRTTVIERLTKMGLTEDRILAAVEARKVDDVDLEKLEKLIGLGTAVKEGEATLEAAFPQIAPPIQSAKVKGPEAAPAKKGEKKADAKSAPTAATNQEQLAQFVTKDCGSTFDKFMVAAIDQGWVSDSCAATTFAELEQAVCVALLSNKEAVKSALTQ
jgi:hypothetical protein